MKKARLPESIQTTHKNVKPHLWTNKPDEESCMSFSKVRGRGTDIDNFWGVAKMVRHLIVNQATRGFDSLRPSQLFCGVAQWHESVRLVNGKM